MGCAKNRVDSECLAGELKRAGHELVEDVELAEVGIVNTCGFIRPAVEESVAAILDLEQLKQQGKLKKIGVVGCLVNRYDMDLTSQMPAVDFWAQSEDWKRVIENLGGVSASYRCRTNLPASSPYTRYLKISEGCDNRCTYCAIPGIRGGLRSLPVDLLVKEAQQLVEEGAKELCVVGQDLTVYGTDLSNGSDLVGLLDALESSLPKNIWIRLLYLHPSRVTTRLLERVASGTQVLSYLDIPIQHADANVLASMNRAIDPAQLLAIFQTARSIDTSFALRTTCMVGFPGEGAVQYDNLLRFIEAARFDRLGAFTFFPEEGTEAATMHGQVPDAIKQKRLEKLLVLQENISIERQRDFLGKTLDVLIDRVETEYGFAEGRSFREAPEVDGLIEVRGVLDKIKQGDVVSVRMTEAMPHDMVGEVRAL